MSVISHQNATFESTILWVFVLWQNSGEYKICTHPLLLLQPGGDFVFLMKYWNVYHKCMCSWANLETVISLLYFSDRGIVRDGNGPHDKSEHAAWCFCSWERYWLSLAFTSSWTGLRLIRNRSGGAPFRFISRFRDISVSGMFLFTLRLVLHANSDTELKRMPWLITIALYFAAQK